MASNKFATMLYRNTNRVAVILVYTILEWILIALLLLNALFSFLISKFASYFGLKPPCLICSRIDHVFEPGKGRKSYRDLVCDNHAAEISELRFCSNHRKLSEASGMCEDCSSSRPLLPGTDRTVALFSWMKSENNVKDLRCSCCDVTMESGFYSPYLFLKPSWGVLEYTQKGDSIEEKRAEGEDKEGLTDGEIPKEAVRMEDHQVLSPVCANEGLEKVEEVKDEEVEGEDKAGVFVPEPVVTADDASSEILALRNDYIAIEECLVTVELIDSTTLKNLDSHISTGKDAVDHQVLSPVCANKGPEKVEEVKDEEVEGEDKAAGVVLEPEVTADDASSEIHVLRHDYVAIEERLVSVEWIDSTTLKNLDSHISTGKDAGELGQIGTMSGSIVDIGIISAKNEALISTVEITDKECSPMPETQDKTEATPPSEESNGVSCDFQTLIPQRNEIIHIDLNEDLCDLQAIPIIPQGKGDEVVAMTGKEDYRESQASEEDSKMVDSEANCEVSIGSEICDQEYIDPVQLHEPIPTLAGPHHQSFENHNDVADNDQEMKTEPVETLDRGVSSQVSIRSEHNDVEVERSPETPTYVEGLHNLHNRFLFERTEIGTESLDGSVVSEIDGSDILTVDHLKASLKAERKALSSLYAELEEERSASAIAANQTMAMITRLQEEKAAMQMEALQYQRMMEEQSEYDQEALQFLNELMMKREKEKQDLEKELEVCRKKVLLYEAMERRRPKRARDNGRSGTSSASSSAEDSDDLSFEFNEGDGNFYGLNESNQNTPADAVLSSGTEQETAKHLITLDESLADFEEERLSILEQLKALEQKLFTMDDEESPMHINTNEHFAEENDHGLEENCEFSDNDCIEFANGFSDALDSNGKHHCNGFSDALDSNGKHHCEIRNISFRGKRLLPLFDATSMENEDSLCEEQETPDVSQDSFSKFTSEQNKLAIAAEVDNVYERLQALEADREFIKHCMRSLKKGDKGMDLLQEILQHLRDLKTVELRVRNAGDALASLAA